MNIPAVNSPATIFALAALLATLAIPSAAHADCDPADQTVTQGLHYPALSSCVDAIDAAENVSQSYHYQNACSQAFGTPIGSFPFNDWHSVENVTCSDNHPGFPTGTVVWVNVCCDHGIDPAAQVDALLDDMLNSINNSGVPGANGLINKLEDIRDDVVDSTADYNAGLINLADYLQALNDAIATLDAFDNQLAAKIGNGQIVNPEATDLTNASAQLRQIINDMIAAL